MDKKLLNKDFLLLLQGNAVSTIGDLMYSVAIGYWVYEQTGSSALMGIMSSISMFVTMFLSPFCGSIVDKCNRKWLIVGIDTLQGVIMLAVGILAYRNELRVPIVLIAALIASFGGVFYSPAISTLMIDLIPRDDMVRGQSLHSGIKSLISMVGNAFSGAMVAFFGVPLIVVLNGISNLYSAASEWLVNVPRTVQQGEQVTVKGVLADMKCAAQSILADGALRIFVPCVLILNLLGSGPLNLLLPFCREKGFEVDKYGYLVAVYMLAALISVLILGAVKLKPKMRLWVMALGLIGSEVCFILAYCSVRFIPMCIYAFAAGFANSAGNAVFNASLMLALPKENRSAILGLIESASVGGCAISAVLYGALGDIFPMYIVFAVGSLIALFPMVYMCFHRKIKEFVLKSC